MFGIIVTCGGLKSMKFRLRQQSIMAAFLCIFQFYFIVFDFKVQEQVFKQNSGPQFNYMIVIVGNLVIVHHILNQFICVLAVYVFTDMLYFGTQMFTQDSWLQVSTSFLLITLITCILARASY